MASIAGEERLRHRYELLRSGCGRPQFRGILVQGGKANMDARESKAGQHLTFTLGQNTFAMDIALVCEVLDYPSITQVPRLPRHLLGVINLRGGIVSVVDLHFMLGAEVSPHTRDTCVIIVEVTSNQDSLKIGVLADSVREVVYYQPDQITPPPPLGTKINPAFMRGVVCFDDQYVIILNLEKVLAVVEAEVASSDLTGIGGRNNNV